VLLPVNYTPLKTQLIYPSSLYYSNLRFRKSRDRLSGKRSTAARPVEATS